MPLDRKTERRIFWGNVIIVVIVIAILLYPSFVGPSVQFTAADPTPDPVLACPGDVVPIRYHIVISHVPTSGNRTVTFRSEQRRATVRTAFDYVLPLNLNDPVDRVIDQGFEVPATYQYEDPASGRFVETAVAPGETLVYQRGVTALTRTGIYRYSNYERSVQIREDCP